jgi:hypothetical protein
MKISNSLFFLYHIIKSSNPTKILFLYLFFLLSITQCYVKIPLKYYPEKIHNETSPSNTMDNLVYQKLYSTLEIGSPKQLIQIPVTFETSDFYISKNEDIVNDYQLQSLKIKLYNDKTSNSLKVLEDQGDNIYYGVNFFLATKVKDIFYFGDKNVEMEFYLGEHLNEIMPGELGLQLHPVTDLNTAFDSDEKSFLKKIKNNGLTNNYIWSIIFNNNNDNDGYLYIGDYLHNIDNKKYNEASLLSINAYIYQNEVKPEFVMNKLIIYKNNNINDIVKEIKLRRNYLRVNLDYHLGGIIGSEILRPYLEEYIFTEENNCYKGTFKNRGTYRFYYCNNNANKIRKIKNDFPTIQFTQQDLNYNFTIKADDLFIEKDEYVFCLMIFDDYKKYEWKLGKPFIKKYAFMLDQDGKTLYFYSVIDEVIIQGVKSTGLIFMIFVLLIVFSFLGFILGRKIYRSKYKKHANVLEDSFEYNSSDDFKYEKGKGSEIEMRNKLVGD